MKDEARRLSHGGLPSVLATDCHERAAFAPTILQCRIHGVAELDWGQLLVNQDRVVRRRTVPMLVGARSVWCRRLEQQVQPGFCQAHQSLGGPMQRPAILKLIFQWLSVLLREVQQLGRALRRAPCTTPLSSWIAPTRFRSPRVMAHLYTMPNCDRIAGSWAPPAFPLRTAMYLSPCFRISRSSSPCGCAGEW